METAEDAYGETIRIGDTVVFNYGGLMKGEVVDIRKRRNGFQNVKELTILATASNAWRGLKEFASKQKDSRATVKI